MTVGRKPADDVSPEEAVENRPAASIVADALRERIIHQALKGGERLRQDAIANRFGVSQMIVREAFRQLTTEGFLKSEPRRGVSVAMMTADEVVEMTQLRSLIESQALEWAIPNMTKADIEKAGKVLSELDKAKGTNKIIALNAKFHEILYLPATKERTLTLIATLRRNFERYLRFTWEETHHREQSQREHWEILEQCKQRNVEAARATLERHIQATGALLLERLQSLTD